MANRFNYSNAGSSVLGAIAAELQRQEAAKRQQMLDGIAVEDKMRERARLDMQAQRQAEQDRRQAEQDKQDALDRAQAQADRLAKLRDSNTDLTADEATRLRAGDYAVTERSTLPARVGNPFDVNGQETLKSVLYARRDKTALELMQEEKAAKAEAAAAAANADRIREREQDRADALAKEQRDREQHYRDAINRPRPEDPLVIVQGPDGNDVYVPRSQAVGKRPGGKGNGSGATQSQLAADAFYSRGKSANDVLDTIDNISTWDRFSPNFAQSDTGQAYQQARRQFTEAYLRRDSGAAISDSEYRNADQTYFPQLGDSPATLTRKREARQAVLASIAHQGSGAVQAMPSHAMTGRKIGRYEVVSVE